LFLAAPSNKNSIQNVKTGQNGATFTDIASVICVSIVRSVSRADKDIYELRSEILCITLRPMHGDVLLSKGPARIHYDDVAIEVV
jgi:hypothetical protein